MQSQFNIKKSVSVFHHVNSVDQKTDVIKMGAEKAFNKIQHPFVRKKFQQTRTRKELDSSDNGYPLKTYSNHNMREMLKAYFLRLGVRQ